MPTDENQRSSRVVLVNPPMRLEQVYGDYSEWGSISPPTGMLYIASLLRASGIEVHLIDAEAMGWGLQQTVQAVLDHSPDVVGLAAKSLWVVSAHRVAQELKARRPELAVVVGGNHVTALPERTLHEFACFDVGVVGEGEHTFLELTRVLAEGGDLSQVAGIVYRDGEEIRRTPPRGRILDLDELPSPAFDLLPDIPTHYKPPLSSVEKVPAFSIVASRGCPARCTFCDRSVFGGRVTKHSPEYIVRMIRELHDRYGIRYLMFDDDNLLLNRKHLFRLLDLLGAEKYHMPFTCQSRVDTITEETLAALRRAGCRLILYGVESGSQQMLDRMKKGITVEQVRQAVRMTRKAGIKPAGFFILGHPGETVQTMQETVQLIRQCAFHDVGVFLFTPLPGSEVYENVAEYGQYDEDWERMNAMDEVVFVPHGLTAELLREYSDKCYQACYMRAWQVLTAYRRCSSVAHLRAVLKSVRKMVLPSRS